MDSTILTRPVPPDLGRLGRAGFQPAQTDAPDSDASPSTSWTLRSLFGAHRRRILLTYGLLNLENLLHLAQPWVLGLAISDLLRSSYLGLLMFMAQHLTYLVLSAGRRMYDARAFNGIHAELAARLVVQQRSQGVEVSRLATRSALSREIVDFFERDIPFCFQVLYAVGGALVMLAVCDLILVPFCLALLVPVSFLSARGARKTLTLNASLNDELEREVDVIRRGRREEVTSHYRRAADWRVRLADWQAFSFGTTELFVLGLLALTLFRCCTAGPADLGRIFAVFGYILMFVGSLASVPLLVQQVSRLRDITRRMDAGGPKAD